MISTKNDPEVLIHSMNNGRRSTKILGSTELSMGMTMAKFGASMCR